MEALRNALLGELAGRTVSFLVSTYESSRQATAPPASVREEESLRRLRRLLLRGATIVEEAERRRAAVASRLLGALRDEMFRGHYVLDTATYHQALTATGGARRRHEDGGEEASLAFAPSRFNPAKRVRRFLFAAGESEPDTTAAAAAAVISRATPLELQQMVRRLEAVLADTKELVVVLMAARCPPPAVHYRQPYSAHLFMDRYMFARHAERDQVLEFLLRIDDPPAGAGGGGGGAANPGVLPIVGPALIGKSTLVEHVCADERVRNHFSLIMFYNDNGEGQLEDETMATFSENCTIKHQNNDLADERWLIVIELLGDVEDKAWKKLYSHGRSSSTMPQGSKIILTSRSEKITRLGTTTRPLKLTCLSTEAMWYFFKLRVFGSTDPEEHHPKLASLAMEMALEARGSFMAANILATMLKADFSVQLWRKVLATVRQYMRENLVLFGEYPDDLKAKDRPRQTWSVNKLKPNECFLMYETYQQQNCCSGREEEFVLPEITIVDMLSGRAKPRGKFEILFWKSVIPPYFSYICPCEIRDM